MKKLPLKSTAYQYVEKSFSEWLDILGYSWQSVYSMPCCIRELLHYIEQQGKTQIKDITKEIIREYYYNHLRNRSNTRRGGALGTGHLNKHLQSIYKFCQYLRQSGRLIIPSINIKWEKEQETEVQPLTEEEIKQLYNACDQYPTTHGSKPQWFYPAMALRDKAMLSVFYGCGLRRNEGMHLELSDIFWDKKLLYVRKGKNYKERFVPISKAGIKHFENYIYEARPLLLREKKEERFFINERSKRTSGASLLLRLNQLIVRTENEDLINRKPGLHTLRHSIATHLLSNGMKLEKIKDFLGHDSLESTQIYTHLIEQDNGQYEYNPTGRVL